MEPLSPDRLQPVSKRSYLLMRSSWLARSRGTRRSPGYWESKENRRAFLLELGNRTGVTSGGDWLRLGRKGVVAGGGRSLLRYHSSFRDVLSSLLPEVSLPLGPSSTHTDACLALGTDNHSGGDGEVSLHSPKDTLKTGKAERKPRGYWQNAENVKAFLEDLKGTHNIQKAEDWKEISKNQLSRAGGKGLFRYYSSMKELLSAAYPNLEMSLFSAPVKQRGVWKDAENQKQFLEEFRRSRGLSLNAEDWKGVSAADIRSAGGRAILLYHRNLHEILSTNFPEEDWTLLAPSSRTRFYWKDMKNQRAFLDQFYRDNNLTSQADWSQISREMVGMAGGRQLLTYYPSLFDLLQSVYPELEWNPFCFPRQLPNGFWNELSNQRAFLDYLSKKFNIQSAHDWRFITVEEVKKEGGGTFLRQYSSFYNALESLYPELEWNVALSRKQAPRDYWKDSGHCRKFLERALGADHVALRSCLFSRCTHRGSLRIWWHRRRSCRNCQNSFLHIRLHRDRDICAESGSQVTALLAPHSPKSLGKIL